MNWLRLHHEARTDKKLESLTDAQFRVWFRLLCFSGEQPVRGSIGYDDLDLLAIEVAGGDSELLTATLERLVKLKMIEADGSTVFFRNFEKRQFDKPSDAPERVSERVKRHREQQRNADATPRNADVTRCNALDTDTELDTEPEPDAETKEKRNSSPKSAEIDAAADFDARFYGPYPRHVKRDDALKAWVRLKPKERDDAAAALQAWLAASAFSPELSFVPYPASWLNGKRWKDDLGAVNPPKPVEFPEPLQKRIENWTTERLNEGKDILPYPPGLQAAIDDFLASRRLGAA